MDWEALCELQQALLDEPAAVIVSPAPMFGAKLIETVQRVFTWAGHLLVGMQKTGWWILAPPR